MEFPAFLSLFSWDNFTGTNWSNYKQHGELQLQFQFGDKYKGQKSELWIYTGVICQRSSYFYIIWVSGCRSRFLELLNWNRSASEIHLSYFTCYPIHIQYALQYRIPVQQYIAIPFLLGDTHPYAWGLLVNNFNWGGVVRDLYCYLFLVFFK